jgi:hypothetical protein
MRQKELRIALVCYGGVSLAVYMHGVTKELWHLARASRDFHGHSASNSGVSGIYRELLEMIQARHDLRLRVLPDIVSGASAGGINAVFQREGTTLFTRVPISFSTAALGGMIEIPGLDGENHAIEIPVGIQTGRQLRKRGAGMPVLQSRGRGDLVTEITVETPTKLSKEQRAILEQFRETETGDECPESRGFFDKLKGAFGG